MTPHPSITRRLGLAALALALAPCAARSDATRLWSAHGQPTTAAIAFIGEMGHAERRGLDPADYPSARLGELLEAVGTSDAAAERFDRALSLVGGRFIAELHFGRIDPAQVGHHLTIDREALDLPATLAALAAAPRVDAFLDGLEPAFEHFRLLKQQLARYRALALVPDLTTLPPLPAKSLRPGAPYSGAAQLRRLLIALGDLAPDAEAPDAPAALTPPLVTALKRFKRRHGAGAGGTLDAATFAELTRPLSSRVRQIELTLERWRWMPRKLASAPIVVNIPQFHLYAFASATDTEAGLLQMDVIVGKAFEATQTPVFSADMTTVVFRPYWEVPTPIARHELVPSALRDPKSLERHQMEIVRGYGETVEVLPASPENLARVARGELRIRQRPGPDNALGLIKFNLPNPYDVYLHATPARALFGQSRRAFSHGCVRVGDPVGLAEYVLRGDPQWNRDRILVAMQGEQRLEVRLPHPIRVFILYGTALATEAGDMLFFDDVYRHDQRLEQALAARRAAKAALFSGADL